MPKHNRRRRKGRGRRASGMLESTLLLLLHYEPAHGYTLLEELNQFGLGAIDPSAVYRMLRNMEEKNWVVSAWDEEETLGPPRRVYRITELGDQVLAAWMKDLEETQQMIDRLIQAYRVHMKTGEGDHH